MTEGKIYETVGIECGTLDGERGPVECVGIMYPLENSHIDDVFDVRFMTLPCAKALLLDLRDAIEACEKHQRGEPTE